MIDPRDIKPEQLEPEDMATLDRLVVLIRGLKLGNTLVHLRRRLSQEERQHLAALLVLPQGESGRWGRE